MLVKYISEKQVLPYVGIVEIDGAVYTNDESKAYEAGYLPFIAEKMPEATDGYDVIMVYEKAGTCVYGKYQNIKLEEEVN